MLIFCIKGFFLSYLQEHTHGAIRKNCPFGDTIVQLKSKEPENSHSYSSLDDSENQTEGESIQTWAEVHKQQG
jgi:hypothetical protein